MNTRLIFHEVMDRDRRLTGFLRGQTDNVRAPKGFELSNPWRVSSVGFLPYVINALVESNDSLEFRDGFRSHCRSFASTR